MSSYLVRHARFSRCRQYRYTLKREWGDGDAVMFVGLNPSTADHRIDDPTVRRCVGFAQRWGFGSLLLTNLFGFRSTDPSILPDIKDPVGPSNDRIIREVAKDATLIIVAWGSNGNLQQRDGQILEWLPDPHCLGFTKSGCPRHPLYMPSSAVPVPFL